MVAQQSEPTLELSCCFGSFFRRLKMSSTSPSGFLPVTRLIDSCGLLTLLVVLVACSAGIGCSAGQGSGVNGSGGGGGGESNGTNNTSTGTGTSSGFGGEGFGGGMTTNSVPQTCAEALQQQSYIGCEYWPTISSNSGLYEGFEF